MAANANDLWIKVGEGTATTLASPGYTIGATSITVVSTTNWDTSTGQIFAIDTAEIVNGEQVQIAGTYCEFEGVVTGATTIASVALISGTPQNYTAGALTRVYIPVSSEVQNRMVDGLLEEHKQDGTHADITADSVTATDAVLTNATITNLTVGSQTPSADWTTIGTAPNTVTYNGQRSYSLVFNGVDYTNILSPGQRLKTTRTVAAPTQCTSLNGTTQYWNKTSPNKLTFTDDFVVDAYVKLTSYAASAIVSRYNGTSGWELIVGTDGTVQLRGFNAGSSNIKGVASYQSIPLNKWVRVTTQLDMNTATLTSTTNYIMIDGVDVPANITQSGTNPTALIQAGNLEIGSRNGGTLPFPGKIAQVAIYNAKVTQANIKLTHSQGLTGSETSLASAYSFNGVATDLNTTTPNDLTAQASATATNADSPFGTQATGLISSTLDYGIVQSATFSTNTTAVVQIPEGCTIPTSGGVSAVSYSGLKAPYGFPGQKDKWRLSSILKTTSSSTSSATYTTFISGGWTLGVPIGNWEIGFKSGSFFYTTVDSRMSISSTALTGGTANGECAMRFLSPSGTAVSPGSISIKRSESAFVTYVMYTIGATVGLGVADIGGTEIFAENGYL